MIGRLRRLVPWLLAGTLLAAPSTGGAAPEPVVIPVILSLTGSLAYGGHEHEQAHEALEALVNRTGGIRGQPVRFAVEDDQTNPRVAVQLVQNLIAQRVPVILGPSFPASCSAVAALIPPDGPVQYCLSNGIRPAPGGYVFSSLFATSDMLAAALRFFRDRGWTRVAYIVSTDSTGQDAERAIVGAFAQPENKSLRIVERQYFATTDLNVTAQMTRIKAANPQVVIAWAAGTAAVTLLRGAYEAGLDVPVMTSPGNLVVSLMKQWNPFLPRELYFPGSATIVPQAIHDRAWRAALDRITTGMAAYGVVADQVHASTWDPTMLVVDALRALGPGASAVRLHAYLEHLDGWVGVNGPYDFRAIPQRGIGQSAVIMVRWDASAGRFEPVSGLGGAPVARREHSP